MQRFGKEVSNFTTTKSYIIELTCEHLNKLDSRNIPVCYIQMEPAGENVKLSKHAENTEWATLQPIDFEFTSHETSTKAWLN